MDLIKAGNTDQTVYFRLRDATTGLAKTGLLFNSAGASCYYTRNRGGATAITLATLASATAAHADGGFIEVHGTNAKGLYRLDLPDAAIATGSRGVEVSIEFDGVIEETKEIALTGPDFTDGVRMGLTALPNVAAEAAGGLYTRGTGTGQLNQTVDGQLATVGAATAVTNDVGITQAGADKVWSTTTRTITGLTTAAIKSIWDQLTSALTTAGSIGKKLADWVIGTTQTGDSFARLGAPAGASVSADIATVDAVADATKAKTDNLPADPASEASVTAIQNNTRVRVIIPSTLERPDAASTAYQLDLYIYDTEGNMEAPDSLPTITASNEAGTDRSTNLGTVTLVSTGVYKVSYTVSSTHLIEQIRFEWSIVEGGVTKKHGTAALIVDTTAVDFTAADRTKLDTLHDTRLTAARATNLDNLDATVSSRAAASVCTEARLAELDPANLPADVATLQSDTDDIQSRLPAALVGGRMDANVGAMGAGVLTAAAIATDAITAAKIAADAIGASELAADAVNEIRDAILADSTPFNGANIDAAVSSRSSHSADDVVKSVNGTADSGTTTTLVDAARTETDTDYWKGAWLLITSGNLTGQRRRITAFNPATDTITVDAAFTQAVATHNYMILRTGYGEAPAAGSGDWTTAEKEQIRDALGVDGTKTAAISGDLQDMATVVNTVAADVVNLDGAAMRGTESAALASVCTEARLAELDPANLPTDVGTLLTRLTDARAALLDDWINGGRLDLILDIIAGDVVNLNGAAMRGTDNAALASVLGALADAAADGDPTSADTLIQYVKQLINILVGSAGVVAFPAEAAPANAVSLAEVIRAIHADVATTIPGRLPAALVGGRMDSDIGAKTGNVPLSAQEKLDVNTEADAAFATFAPPTKAEMDAAHALLATPAQVAAELATYDGPTKAEMDTAHALLATPAQVNAQVADVVRTDTTGEPGQGAPPVAASLSLKVDYVYKALINLAKETATLYELYNGAGTVVDQKIVTSDTAGTLTKNKMVSGP